MKNGMIYAVGIGPGARELMTPAAADAIRESEVIAGYGKYLELIQDLIAGKQQIRNGMGAEVQRCTAAMDAAADGKIVSVISSGDAGLLAMAGLLFELRDKEERYASIEIRVIPGITAAFAAASVLGAPLQNGCCLLNLSDLLTPEEEVLSNARQLSATTMACALYNPAGRNRRTLLEQTLAIFREARGTTCACAYVRHAYRKQQEAWLGTLAEIPMDAIDMSTIVIIGGPHAVIRNGSFYEERGYAAKWSE